MPITVAYAAECSEAPKPLPLPSPEEKEAFIRFYNQNPPQDTDTCGCAGKMILRAQDDNRCPQDHAGCPQMQHWDMLCDDIPNLQFSLLKGDIHNDGQTLFLLQCEGGTSHSSSIAGVYQQKDGEFLSMPLYVETPRGRTILPLSEALDMPGHFAEPFLTNHCGEVTMNFVNSTTWTIDQLPRMTSQHYVWKADSFRHVP